MAAATLTMPRIKEIRVTPKAFDGISGNGDIYWLDFEFHGEEGVIHVECFTYGKQVPMNFNALCDYRRTAEETEALAYTPTF